MHEPFKSGLAKEIFEMALEFHTPEPQVPMDLTRDLELSLQRQIIALHLARAWWLMAGQKLHTMRWESFSQELKDRYLGLAERAIATIDPGIGLRQQAEAAKETRSVWPSTTDHKPSGEDIANYAISTYEFRLSRLRIENGEVVAK